MYRRLGDIVAGLCGLAFVASGGWLFLLWLAYRDDYTNSTHYPCSPQTDYPLQP